MSEHMTEEEAGRLLIVHGRRWSSLTEEDIARGASAVVKDPTYRTEIWRSAVRHCEECCSASCASTADINAAYSRLGGGSR